MASNIARTTAVVPGMSTSTHPEPEQTSSRDEITAPSRKSTVPETDSEKDGEKVEPSGIPHSFGFYAIIVALCFSGLLTALEATVTSTALPTIIAVLGGDDLFIWVVNGYYLTM